MGALDQLLTFAQHHKSTVGLGEQYQELVQQFAEQQFVRGPCELLSDLQDHLKLVAGIVDKERVIGRQRRDRGTNGRRARSVLGA